MSKVKLPNEETIEKQKEIERRRKEKHWILDPKDVSRKDSSRIMTWARGKMIKHEHLFKSDIPNGHLIADGNILPEELDVPAVYRFPNLNWIIQKEENLFIIKLLSRHKILFRAEFAKI